MSDNDLIRRGAARKMKFAGYKIGADGRGYIPHWVTCPFAEELRR